MLRIVTVRDLKACEAPLMAGRPFNSASSATGAFSLSSRNLMLVKECQTFSPFYLGGIIETGNEERNP